MNVLAINGILSGKMSVHLCKWNCQSVKSCKQVKVFFSGSIYSSVISLHEQFSLRRVFPGLSVFPVKKKPLVCRACESNERSWLDWQLLKPTVPLADEVFIYIMMYSSCQSLCCTTNTTQLAPLLKPLCLPLTFVLTFKENTEQMSRLGVCRRDIVIKMLFTSDRTTN